jgi:hypothetical protein
MSNIIKFPRVLDPSTNPTSEEERIQIVSNLRRDLSDDITDDIMQAIIGLFVTYGLFTSTDELNIKDAIFLEETIKAAVYRYKGIDHKFHTLIDDIVLLPGEEDEGEYLETEDQPLTENEKLVTID